MMIRRCLAPLGAALLPLVVLLLAAADSAAGAPMGPRFHTRSIVACDPAEGACGVAVVSFPTGVPAIVPVGEPGVMVANQSFPSLATAEAIVKGVVKRGLDAPTALARALADDPAPEERQFGVAALFSTASGVSVANHTGAANIPATCATLGDTYSVQANLQTSGSVCDVMAGAFEATEGSLARRLLAALLAGSAASSDARGEYSASIKVYTEVWPLAGLTELGADANVNRARNWETKLEYELNAFLAMLTPPDPRDRVELTRRLAKRLQRALRKLGYYAGPVDGGTLFIDGPLADHVLAGKRRGVLVRNPAV